MIPLTHHAVLVRGAREATLGALEEALSIHFRSAAHPDVVYEYHESLGIDEVRALTYSAQRMPTEGSMLRLIIAADAITHEAQNALLKLTEDPPAKAHFVFVLPSSFPIIPTFRSRFLEVIVDNEEASASEVFSDTIGATLERIVKLSKNSDNEGMESMLHAAEREVHEQKSSTAYARALLLARRYIEARGASSKMLLEHLVISRAEVKTTR